MIIPQNCDIVLTKSAGLLGVGIRFFENHPEEAASKVNHVGIMVDEINIIEALSKTVERPLATGYSPPSKTKIAIYRPLNLTENERNTIITKARSYVGKTYGYTKILAHILDWFLGGKYVFRRLTNMDKYPICSWVVAQAYAKAGKFFGVAPGSANPDDIWDFVVANPDKYTCIWPLSSWV